MKRSTIRALGLGLLGLSAVPALHAEDMSINRLLAAQCAQCHGTDGHAVGDMDSLHDESPKDLFEDLMDMRSEDRPENIMDHQAMGYTEDQIRRIAAYFGTVSGKSDEQPEPGDDSSKDGDREDKVDRERRKKRAERQAEAEEKASESSKKDRERRKKERERDD